MRARYTTLAVSSAFAALATPLVASAATPTNLVELGNMIAGIFNKGTTFLVLLAVVIYFGGVAVALFHRSQGRVDDKGKTIFGVGKFSGILLGGIIIIFVMVSIWGIIGVLQNTLFNTKSPTANPGSATTPGTDLQFTDTPRLQ